MVGRGLLSPRSSRVKAARKLSRRAVRMAARQFLVEGPQVVAEALALPGCVREVFATKEATEHHDRLAATATHAQIPWRLAEDAAVESLAGTVTPQGLVAVCGFVDQPLREALQPAAALTAVCVDVRDPGNAGTVIRCADAAGVDAVVLAGTSVDPYNQKTVRASAGSLFHLPVVFGTSAADTVAAMKNAGLTVLAADTDGGTDLHSAQMRTVLSEPCAWLFGNEARGLPSEVTALADRVVSVPIYGRAESLNLATAAAVCLYTSAWAHQ